MTDPGLRVILDALITPMAGNSMLNEGDKAPAFSLMNQDNELVSLSDFAGKNVVLWFYPRASTPG